MKVISGVRYLYCTDEISSIKKAFELRAERLSYRDISERLLREDDFNIKQFRSIQTLLTKTLFIGEFTSKETGEIFIFPFEE